MNDAKQFYANLLERVQRFPLSKTRAARKKGSTNSPPFDPLTATNQVLEENGLPLRPDPRTEPQLFLFWGLMLGQPFNLVKPEFPETFEVSLPPPADNRENLAGRRRQGTIRRLESSRNWSGAYITPERPNRFVYIAGGWQVPDPSLPAVRPSGVDPLNGEYRSSTWIGVGGHRLISTSSLPQIGTTQFVKVVNGEITRTVRAFWEWWVKDKIYPTVNILNLEVNIGDEILASLTVKPGDKVLFHIKNQTRGMFTSFVVKPPLDSILPLGTTAEWIMERPTFFDSPQLYPMPHYTDLIFRHCLARSQPTADGPISNQKLDHARLIRMYDTFDGPQRKAFVSLAEKVNSTSIRVFYREAGGGAENGRDEWSGSSLSD
jgi:hypothetical protein